MSAHTPTPWRIVRDDGLAIYAGDQMLGRFHGGRQDYGTRAVPRLADARRIVHCVNTYDDLVAALELIEVLAREVLGSAYMRPEKYALDVRDAARAALARAKGEQT